MDRNYIRRSSLLHGLLMWTSLVRMPNRRSYFTDSKIYNLPHFKAHTTCNRFQQLFTMLHFTNNNQISATLNTAQRFEVKLSNLLTAVNKTPHPSSHRLVHSPSTKWCWESNTASQYLISSEFWGRWLTSCESEWCCAISGAVGWSWISWGYWKYLEELTHT